MIESPQYQAGSLQNGPGQNRFRPLISICALMVAVAGLVSLLGWALELPVLASLGSGQIPVAPSTAVMFVMYAGAIFLRTLLQKSRGSYWTGVSVNAAGALIAAVLLVLSLLDIRPEVEHLGFSVVNKPGELQVGHMSPVTAVCFLLSSLSYLLSLPLSRDGRWSSNLAWWLACCIIAIGSTLVLAYLYGTPMLYGSGYIPPAALTSMAFMALGTALLALAAPQAWPSRPDVGSTTRASYAFILVFVLLAAGIVIAGFLYYRNFEIRHRTEVEHQLSAVADLKVDEIVHWRKERLGDAAFFYKNLNFSELVRRYLQRPDDEETGRRLRTWLQHVREGYQYDRVFLLDAGGKEQISAPEARRPISRHLIQRSAEVLRTKQIALEDFYRNEYDRRVHLAVLIPILDERGNGRAMATLVFRIDPEQYFYPFLNRWPTPSQTAETVLVRREGNEVLFLNEPRFQKNTALNLRRSLDNKELPAAQAVLGRQGVMEGRDYRGVPVIADVRPVPDSPWFLVSRMDNSEVYKPMREKLWMMVALVGALLISAGGGVGLVWRRQRTEFYRERYNASEALRESEERFRILVEGVKDYAIIMLDPAGNVMSWNQGAERIKGYRDDEIIGRHFSRFYIEEDIRQGKPQRELERAAEVGCFEDEGWRMRKDGSRFWANVVISVLRDETGQLRGFAYIIRDITERKRADEALRKSEENFRALIENGSDIISQIDEHGTILYESPSIERILGHRPSDMLGKKAFEFIHPDDIAVVANAISQGMADSGAIYSVEYRFKHHDGTWRTLESVGKSFMSPSGAAGAIVNSRDITERKRAEISLAEKEASLRLLVETIPDMIWLKDIDGRYLSCNRMFEQFFGAKESDIVGKTDYDFVIKELADFFRDHDRKTMAEGKPSSTVEWITFASDGHRALMNTIKTPMYDVAGKLLGVLGIGRDITEYQKLEEQFRHAQKLEGIGTLAGGIAHDFNNILSAIIGYGHITLMKMPKDDPLRMNIEHILESADRAAALTQSLLAFSRKQITNRKLVELNSVLRKAEKFLVRVIGEDVVVRLSLAEDALTIFADAGQLEQVFMNFATNARDAMPHGGSFTIETSIVVLDNGFVSVHGYGKMGTYALISATDTGVGMNEETRKKIFEPFFTTKEVGKGTGLGLAMVYGIIKQHEGFINVYSEPGKGTTFRIYLPLIKTEAMEEQPIIAAEYTKGGTETVLLAEDDASVRKLTVLVLEQMGYTVIVANDGEEAVTKFMENKDRIQLLLFDIIMPKKNGREAYEEIRKVMPDVPVIFESGYSPDMLRVKELVDDDAVLVYKPISPQNLLKKVREVLDRK